MVNRYAIESSAEELKKRYNLDEVEDFKPIYNGHPTGLLPIIKQNTVRKLEFFTWGLMSKWSNNKEMSPKLFNISLTDVLGKRPYKSSIKSRRCIIPASGFYLWKPVSKKKSIPYYFYHEKNSQISIAGIWEEGDEFSDQQNPNFMMITTESNENFTEYQEDFPLILTNEQVKTWLNPDFELESDKNLIESISKGFAVHSVSPLISNIENNSKELIKPSKPADQYGNYTLFG